jgi:hypothetical protein
MKKILLLNLLFLSSLQLIFGQIEKPFKSGNFLTGGSLSFNIEKEKHYEPIIGSNPQQIYIIDRRRFETDLYFGYYVFNNFAIGLKTDLIHQYENRYLNLQPDPNKYYYSNLLFGPFIRYSTDFGIFIEGSASFGFLRFKSASGFTNFKNNSFSLGAGYSIFVTNSVAIEPVIRYKYFHTPRSEDYVTELTTNGLSFAVGFQIYFGSKKNNSK